ncbi:MAG: NUDIX hydrolase [Rhodospirillales bacterium]|nr:NUDIX hydrolase [Rhodospirillales bacterium]
MDEYKNTGPSVECIPEGDTRPRLMCPDCGYIAYENPKIVVGAVCEWEGKILLCRRAIRPRIGFWTIPAGFMELGEGTAAGAAREVWEEACARIEIGSLIGMYEVPRISQVHVFYRARMTEPVFSAGYESQEVALFEWDRLPWDDIAFPSVTWALEYSQKIGEPFVTTAPADSWPREFSAG